MSGVSSAIAALVDWLMWAFLEIAKLIRDGKRTEKQLEPLKIVIQAIINGKKVTVTTKSLSVRDLSPEEQLADWVEFYHDEFGLKCDFSSLRIPERREGFDRLIVVEEGLFIEEAFQECAERFKSCKYYNAPLDKLCVHNDRGAQSGPYAIWVKDGCAEDALEASAGWVKGRLAGITLLERLLLELKYFSETGKHPDRFDQYGYSHHKSRVTVCSGSSDEKGCSPTVIWVDGNLLIQWISDDYPQKDFAFREVIA